MIRNRRGLYVFSRVYHVCNDKAQRFISVFKRVCHGAYINDKDRGVTSDTKPSLALVVMVSEVVAPCVNNNPISSALRRFLMARSAMQGMKVSSRHKGKGE